MKKKYINALSYLLCIPVIHFYGKSKVFLILSFMLAGQLLFNSLYAQTIDLKVTFELKNQTLESGLNKLGKISDFRIAFTLSQVAKYNNITVEKGTRSLKETLNLLLKNTNLTFVVKNRRILVVEQSIPKSRSVDNIRRSIITGVVTDGEFKSLPGVNVWIKGSNRGSITDSDGNYKIEVGAGDVLVFSFIGYLTQEEVTGVKSVHNVQLTQNSKALDEVQVIGYGKTSKRLNTGSVSSITANELSKQTVTNPITGLQGRIAGVQITQDNGMPGSSVRVKIRGTVGISNAGSIPLYVIDGVPFTLFSGATPASDNLNSYGINGANGGISPLSLINPEDIERIDVLKDADATAIYGSRGSNGVILITTKKGSQNRTEYNINIYSGTAKVGHYIPMMNTSEYLQMRKDAFAYAGVTPTTTNAKDLTLWDQNAYTDWQKWAIGGTSNITNATASVSGGNAQTRFLFSSTFRKEGSVFPGNYGANTLLNRVNAGHKSKDGLFNINFSANYTYMTNNLPSMDLSSLFYLPPNYSLYNSGGSLNWTLSNPLSYLQRGYNAKTTNFITNLDLVYEIFKGLKLKANLGYSVTRLNQTQTNPASSQNPATTTTSALYYADNDNDNYIIEPQIEYRKELFGGNLQALIGGTFQETKATGIYMLGTGYSNEDLIKAITAASSISVQSNNNSDYKYTAFFGRINYDWQRKYILDGTLRRDGSSRFGSSHRFGTFGALGLGWIFTQEKFMKNQNILSYGKLRGSYGLTGNDQIPNYQYFSLYSTGSTLYSYTGSTILYPSNIANANLHWETTKKLDIAAELGFLNDRILLKADFYRNRSSDLLASITLPAQSGVTSYAGNLPAVVQNQGWEFELNTVNVDMKNFKWTTNLNLTINRNKLLSFPGLATSSYSTSYVIGQPTDIPLLYHFTGIDKLTGLPTFLDVGNDGLTTDDRTPVKSGHPFYGGLTNSLTYKNFQLDFTFQFNHRMGYLTSYSSVGSYMTTPFGYTYVNQGKSIVNRWRATGDDALYPAASTASSTEWTNYLYYSDSSWGDASYIKLKNVSLNYHLPKTLVEKAHFSTVTLYVQGQNLYTWAKQKYTYDPETSISGTGSGLGTGRYIAMPALRTIVVGLNCKF